MFGQILAYKLSCAANIDGILWINNNHAKPGNILFLKQYRA